MKNNKIIVLCGEASSGKDYVAKRLCLQFGWHFAISYTTREMRPKEEEGVQYYFLDSNEEFGKLLASSDLFEKTEYESECGLLLYGLGKDSFAEDNVTVCIVNPDGLRQLKEHDELKDRIITVHLDVPFKQRFFRYLERMDKTKNNKAELVDRIIRDEKDFMNFKFREDVLSCTNEVPSDVDRIIKELEIAVYGK